MACRHNTSNIKKAVNESRARGTGLAIASLQSDLPVFSSIKS